MAVETTIGGNGSMFVGEDKTIRLELADPATVPSGGTIADATGSVDHSSWTEVFDVRKKDNSADPPILSIVPSHSGAFNALRSSNTLRSLVVLTDTQLNLFRAANYRWSWKRMDDGSETVLAWGTFAPQKATAP